MSDNILIVGAGPVGCLLAMYLAKRGRRIDIYERRPDPRKAGDSGGRSINLALSRRGFDALEPVGLKEKMLALATPMKGRMIHAPDESTIFQPYGKNEDEVIHAVSRGELNRALLNAAEECPGVEIHFEQTCEDVNFKDSAIVLKSAGDGSQREVAGDVIFGCDGSNSAVRHAIARLPRISTSQQYIDYGYKELVIPAGKSGAYLIEQNALHIWPRGGYMFIALPNIDGTFTCTLFFPYEGDESFTSLKQPADVESLFKLRFPDAARLIPDLALDFFNNPTGSLATIKCHPWHIEGKVLLVGDAAHGIVPFLGQGLNCALESVVLLTECIDHHLDDWEGAFVEFNRLRKSDADAVADMALDNFIEMRDRVADAKFLLKKKVELALEQRFFPKFISRYGMIQFHRIGYATAQSRGQMNEYILSELCADITSPEQLDWKAAEKLVTGML